MSLLLVREGGSLRCSMSRVSVVCFRFLLGLLMFYWIAFPHGMPNVPSVRHLKRGTKHVISMIYVGSFFFSPYILDIEQYVRGDPGCAHCRRADNGALCSKY